MSEVRSEVLTRDPNVELERIRFTQDGAERSLVIKRLPRERALEVRLLPFLARKSEHVPRVHSRGIPPPAVPAKDWLLLEDTVAAPPACDLDPREIVHAKHAIERAVAADAPALRALGVPEISPRRIAEITREAGAAATVVAEAQIAAERLAGWPVALVHGDLRCANASIAERVVLGEWRWAHLGCPLLDVVGLTRDLVERGEAVLGIGLSRVYGALADRPIGSDELRAAELLERLFATYVRD